jgi:hypothetical protein
VNVRNRSTADVVNDTGHKGTEGEGDSKTSRIGEEVREELQIYTLLGGKVSEEK